MTATSLSIVTFFVVLFAFFFLALAVAVGGVLGVSPARRGERRGVDMMKSKGRIRENEEVAVNE